VKTREDKLRALQASVSRLTDGIADDLGWSEEQRTFHRSAEGAAHSRARIAQQCREAGIE